MEENKSTLVGILKNILTIVMMALIAFLSYSYGVKSAYSLNSESASENAITKVQQIESIISTNYLWEVDENKVSEAMVKGYVSGLEDVYSEYISKEDMEKYMEDTMGTFTGIGIYMTETTENKILILTPMKGSPAEAAGLLPGDYITKVDDSASNTETIDKAVDSIKGIEGTSVKITIDRDGTEMSFDIIREQITVNPVGSKMLDNNVGYVDFRSFDENTAADVLEAILELQEQGMQGLILDIRNNGGGLVSQSLSIADIFVDKDVNLLYEVDKYGNEEIDKSSTTKLID